MSVRLRQRLDFAAAAFLVERRSIPQSALDIPHWNWPPVARVDNVFGDRNPVCSCVGMEAYES